MNSSEKCQKWIKYNKKSTLYTVLILLILLSNESQHSVNCQTVVSEGLKPLETTIPQLLQNAGDLTPSETVSFPGLPGLPGLDAVRGFFVRNQNWVTPMVATLPAKMATFMTLRALRQQAVTQEQQQQTDGMIRGLRGIAGDCGSDCMFMSGGNPGSGRANNRLRGNRGISNNIQNQGGDGGNFGGDGGCGGACDDDNKKTMMLFVGDGNIQVKNHGE